MTGRSVIEFMRDIWDWKCALVGVHNFGILLEKDHRTIPMKNITLNNSYTMVSPALYLLVYCDFRVRLCRIECRLNVMELELSSW